MSVKELFSLAKSDEFHIEGCEEKEVNLCLKRCGTTICTLLKGKVFSCGKPVAGAVVKAFDEKFAPVEHTLTDCEGRYSFMATLKPGKYQIAATAEGFEMSRSVFVELRGCDEKVVNFDLKPAPCECRGVLYGEVFDCATHEKVEGAVLTLFEKGCQVPVGQAFSNAWGQYLFYNLRPGVYDLKAYKKWYETGEILCVTVAGCAFTRADVELKAVPCAHKDTVSGIISCDGHPLCGAAVALYRLEGDRETLVDLKTTNEEGLYLFFGLEPGRYVVKAKMQNGAEFFEVGEIAD